MPSSSSPSLARPLLALALAMGSLAIACDEPAAPPPLEETDPDLLRFRVSIPDTVYGRSVTAIVDGAGIRNPYGFGLELIMDPGTPNERRVTRSSDLDIVGARVDSAGAPGIRLDFTDTLSNGAHELLVRFVDDTGRVARAVVRRRFVVSVATRDYRIVALPSVGRNATLLDINAAGDVVGSVWDADSVERAAAWRARQLVVLPTPMPARVGRAYAINDVGTIVGVSLDTGTTFCLRALEWRGDLVRHISRDPRTGCSGSFAVDVSDDGAVLLIENASDLPGSAIERAGSFVSVPLSMAHAMNAQGHVAGAIYLPSEGIYRAAVAGVTVPMIGPRASGGHSSGEAVAINARDEVAIWRGGYGSDSKMVSTPTGVTDVTAALGGPALPISLVDLTDGDAANGGVLLAYDARERIPLLWQKGRTIRGRLLTGGFRLEGLGAMNESGVIAGRATELGTGRIVPVLLMPQ